MSELFLAVLNMSLKASYVILFVMIIRLLLRKAPKVISYALWGVVAFRLIIPFSFESMFSLMPRDMNTITLSNHIFYQQRPQTNIGVEVIDAHVNQAFSNSSVEASGSSLHEYLEIGAYIWVLGFIALLTYSFISILILKSRLKSANTIGKNIFEAKHLKTPFVLGVINPKIYLPVGLTEEEQNYVLMHERTHIRRKDHIIKLLAFSILSIHWFNPLVWIAFQLMSTDMELSCDERVLKEVNEDIRKSYANSLLSLATGKYIMNGSPLAFGEGNIKGRIKNVLNYKKPKFWVITVAIIGVIVAVIGLITNPNSPQADAVSESIESDVTTYELMRLKNGEVLSSKSLISEDMIKLAEDIIASYMIKSAGWPGIDISTLEECYLIRVTYPEGTIWDFYTFIYDGKAVMQMGLSGHYSIIDDVRDLYEKIVELMSSSQRTDVEVEDSKTINDSNETRENDAELMPGFTEEEVAAARAVVEEYYRAIKEKDDEAILKTLTPRYNKPNVVLYGEELRTLLTIDYDENDLMRKSYVEYGRGSINDVKIEDVIVFRVSFKIEYPKGISGSFEEGDYKNWSMILIRDNKDSPWLIDDQGY